MSYSIATWNVTPDSWNVEKDLTGFIITYLIKSNEEYYIFIGSEWLALGAIELTQEIFEEYGMVDISTLFMPSEDDVKPIHQLEDPVLLVSSISQPLLNVVAIPESQLVLPTKDIVFKMLQSVDGFELITNSPEGQYVRVIFSVDSGETWMTFNSSVSAFESIDTANFEDISERGVNIETFNAIGAIWNEVVKEGKIRFGYYIEMNDVDSVAEIDRLDATINIVGSWKNTVQGEDYNYGYGNEKVNVKIFRDGGYKINYM